MLVDFIIVIIITLIVYGIRYALWKEEVPQNITKYRWAIAIVCTIIFLFIGVAIQYSNNPTSSQSGGEIVYAILLFTIANILKNPEKPKQNE